MIEIETMSQNMISFLLSAAGSAAVLAFLYVTYLTSSWFLARRDRGYGCWWLPDWDCWRLVVRNIDGRVPLSSIRYRVWLRSEISSGPGSSVVSYEDKVLASGERLVLPVKQDEPILCFRLETQNGSLALVCTNKFGKQTRSTDLTGVSSLCFELSYRTRRWWVFKFERFQSVVWSRTRKKLPERDLFVDYLLRLQDGGERQMAGFMKSVDETFVSA